MSPPRCARTRRKLEVPLARLDDLGREVRFSSASGYPEEPMTVSEHLKKARLDRSLGQQDVGALVGGEASTAMNRENGYARPRIGFWSAIIHFLGNEHSREPISISEKLRTIRRRRGRAQRALARRLGVDPTTVRLWEIGRRPHHLRCRPPRRAAL